MDYEKKYKNALERAKKWFNAPNADKIPTYANRIIVEIFPELGESEDEHKVEPKFHEGDWIIDKQGIVHQIEKVIENVTNNTFGYDLVGGRYFNEEVKSCRLWTIEDAKDGDVLTNDNNSTFIFKKEYIAGKPTAYCGIIDGQFFEKVDGCWTNEKCYPATKGQTDFLFQKIKEKGYKWDVDAKKLIKITTPIPKFKFGDIIKHKPTGQINTIKYVCSDYYVLDNNNALFFEYQDMWELAASKVEVAPQDKVPTSLEVYHAVNNIKSLENKVSILADEIIALKEKLLALEKLAKDSEIRVDALECGGKPFETPDKAGDNVTLEEIKG